MSPPGTFSHPLFEGGTQILSVAWSTKKKQTDLIDGLLNFDLPSTICILFFFFFISLVVHRLFLKKDQKFYDSLFLMYRILFKVTGKDFSFEDLRSSLANLFSLGAQHSTEEHEKQTDLLRTSHLPSDARLHRRDPGEHAARGRTGRPLHRHDRSAVGRQTKKAELHQKSHLE